MTQSKHLEIHLRSGVTFPDWSVVTSEKVRASLNDTLGHLRMTKRWGHMSDIEEAARRAILNLYVKLGRAPSYGDISDDLDIPLSRLMNVLTALQERDLIVLSQSDQVVEISYPFTDRKTEHQVLFGDVMLNAMCAIDALGVGAMINRDTTVLSKCRHCGCDIIIETSAAGRTVASTSPETSVVWSGVQDIGGCAADTQCSVMAYFCSDNHLNIWREEARVEQNGHRLTMEQGLEAGAAVFIPFLATGKAAAEQLNQKGI